MFLKNIKKIYNLNTHISTITCKIKNKIIDVVYISVHDRVRTKYRNLKIVSTISK